MSVREERDDAILDAALLRLENYHSELSNGFSNHAPMVAEALLALGAGEAVPAWLDRYLDAALPAPAPGLPIRTDDRPLPLGVPEREADWRATFLAEFDAQGWRATLDEWVPVLAPGFAADAAHGVIRTAHAARALEISETPPRCRELANGLARWAATFQTLPGDPKDGRGYLKAAVALERVPLIDSTRRRNQGAITDALKVLDEQPGFAPAVAAMDRQRSVDLMPFDIASTFAGMMLAQARSPLLAIVFTHALTGVAAAHRLGHQVGQEAKMGLIAHAWQFGCALYAAYASEATDRDGDRPIAGVVRSLSERLRSLADSAVAHGDEHVIKLTETCLDFFAATGEHLFLDVAASAADVIPRVNQPS